MSMGHPRTSDFQGHFLYEIDDKPGGYLRAHLLFIPTVLLQSPDSKTYARLMIKYCYLFRGFNKI